MSINVNNHSHENLDELNESYPVNEINVNRLRVLQWNIRGMNDLNKFDSILETLDHCHFPIDVVVIGETWVKEENTTLYDIPGFNSVFSCRNSSNGGLAVYVKSNLSFTVKSNIHVEGFHRIYVEIVLSGRVYDVHGFYRPPSFDVSNFLNIFESVLDKSSRNRSCFIVGDINIPLNISSNNVVVKYRSLLESYGFACSNTFPTRPVSSNILDHVVCRIDDLQRVRNDTIFADQSDHCIVITSFKLFEQREKITLVKNIVDYQKLNTDFKAFLDNYEVDQDVNSCLMQITSTYKEMFDKHTKKIIKNVGAKGNYCPWLNFNLWYLIKIKNNYIKRLKRNPGDHHLKELLKHISNKVTSTKKNCKKMYYDRLLNNTPHSQLWKHINRIFGKHHKPDAITLVENGVKIEDNQRVCETFNNYFANIGTKLASSIKIDPTIDPLSCLRRVSSSIFLTPATTDEVTLLINDLVGKKGGGPGCITGDVVKINSISFSRILAEVFNKILETGAFPDCLKVARVVPVFKSGDAGDVNNYRPISTLSTFNKIIEKLIINRFVPFLNQNNVFYEFQYGFRQGSSTETAISELLDDVIRGIDNKQVVGALFLDLRKAFDTLNHSILLRKLEGYGIRGVANEIIKSYLSNRKQFVSICDSVSSLLPVEVGVPQGSNIGPLLFLLYINDLHRLQLKGVPRLFADDTALFYPRLNSQAVVNDINEDLKILSKYLGSNLLSLNVSKTKYMIFHSSRKNLQAHDIVAHNSSSIEEVKTFKYLGLHLDVTLNWSEHIKNVERKVSSLCGILRRVSYFVPRSTLLKFYYAHVHSALNYLIIAWGRAYKSYLKKLQTLQNRCLKIIFKKPYLFPSIQLYSDNSHNILPIKGLCELQTVMFVHDTLHKTGFHHNVHMPSVSHGHFTRHANHLHLSRAFTTTGQKRISIIGPKLYNELPNELKQIANRRNFKIKLKQHYKLHLPDILGQ